MDLLFWGCVACNVGIALGFLRLPKVNFGEAVLPNCAWANNRGWLGQLFEKKETELRPLWRRRTNISNEKRPWSRVASYRCQFPIWLYVQNLTAMFASFPSSFTEIVGEMKLGTLWQTNDIRKTSGEQNQKRNLKTHACASCCMYTKVTSCIRVVCILK